MKDPNYEPSPVKTYCRKDDPNVVVKALQFKGHSIYENAELLNMLSGKKIRDYDSYGFPIIRIYNTIKVRGKTIDKIKTLYLNDWVVETMDKRIVGLYDDFSFNEIFEPERHETNTEKHIVQLEEPETNDQEMRIKMLENKLTTILGLLGTREITADDGSILIVKEK